MSRRPARALIATAVVIVLAGCGSGTPTSAEGNTSTSSTSIQSADQQWYRQHAKVVDHLSSVVDTAAQRLAACPGNPTVACLGSAAAACAAVTGAAQAAQALPAVPGAANEAAWTTALADYVAGSQNCSSAAKSLDGKELSQAFSDLTDAKAELLKMKDVFQP